MKAFELTLAGYNGATDKTDNLVFWVFAPNIEAIKMFVIKNNLSLHETPLQINIYNWEDGIDFEIDENSNIIRQKRLPFGNF